MEEEIWKDIAGYEGLYQVSSMGRVKSLARSGRKRDKILKGNPNTTGYLLVQLRKDGQRISMLVHRIVMSTFEPVDDSTSLTVNHKDLDIQNNRLTNLEWCTQKDNNEHYWLTADLSKRKTGAKGTNHHLCKLTEQDVREIRRLKQETTLSNIKVGEMFGVKEGTIRNILNGLTWKDIV